MWGGSLGGTMVRDHLRGAGPTGLALFVVDSGLEAPEGAWMRCGNCGRARDGACACVPSWVWRDPEMAAAVRERDAQRAIRFLRRRVSTLSQEALARMCGVAQSTIARAESGTGLTNPRRSYEALQGLGALNAEPVTVSVSSAASQAHQTSPIVNSGELADALIGHTASSSSRMEAFSLVELSREVRRAKTAYQACRYTEVVDRLPRILRSLGQEPCLQPGEARERWIRIKADAYHVAASVGLKCGENGLAWVAADRSRQAAHASRDPVLIGSSTRVYVRALMRDHHYRTAADLAVRAAEQLAPAGPSSTASVLSVYGSLMLIGAVASARNEDRGRAFSLLDEAEEAARGLGGDHNHRWTAFGPTNVSLHRVSAAVELGDAGHAAHQARQIDPGQISPVERKVVLHLDTARAYTQWGRLREAHTALIMAERSAPQELKERPMVHRLLEELRARSTGHLERDFVGLADRVGVV